MNPKYPVYIPSKGRAESRLTVKALASMGVPFSVVVQPQELETYAAVIDPAKILVLPASEAVSASEGGLVRARNWIWEHAVSTGAERHWQIDDNISTFYRYNRNLAEPVTSGTIFRAAEDFVDRYENVAQAGFQYEAFCHWTRERSKEKPPYFLNTRIYSCTLNRNDLPYRYRGVYNDDTDISLRILKDGWVTVLFNAFCIGKAATMTVRGGNTDIYAEDGRRLMAESLAEQHPDVVQVITRWGRPQHYVVYDRFKANELKRKPGVDIPSGVDNYGMVRETFVDGEWVRDAR